MDLFYIAGYPHLPSTEKLLICEHRTQVAIVSKSLSYLATRKRTFSAIVLLMLASVSLAPKAGASTLVQRSSILINGNSGFTAANGVTGGNGTSSNPYIIEGWKIGYSGSPGIEIENATSHFVVRNMYLNSTVAVFRNDTNGLIQGNNFDDSKGGSYDTAVLVASSSSIILTGNNIRGGTALDIEYSSGVTVAGNTLGLVGVWGTFQGLTINGSRNVTVEGNTIWAVMGWGMIVENDDHVQVSGNSVAAYDCSGNYCAHSLYVFSSSNVTLTANNVTGNTGIVAVSSSDLLVYHNDFYAGSSDSQGSNDQWDNGYPSGGNFYSNFAGSDPDGDGIGDTLNVIPGGAFQDHYPLMKPFVASPLVSVVVGTDGNLYSSIARPDGSWNSWQSLSGSTSSSPALCRAGPDRVELVVRGMDDLIYLKSNVNGTWSSSWESLGGLTPDQPACAVLNSILYILVRGMNSGLYYQTVNVSTDTKSGWIYLGGASPSAPALCASGPSSLELLVRGDDNGLYHKGFSAGSWSSVWDKNPSGVMFDMPACAVLGSTLTVVVRGAAQSLWATTFDLSTRAWAVSWTNLQGSTPMIPELVSTPSVGRLDLIVIGMDSVVYHKSFVNGTWSSTWDSPNGVTLNTPATVSDGSDLRIVVVGTDSSLVSNLLPLNASSWSTWTSMNGSTNSAPSAG